MDCLEILETLQAGDAFLIRFNCQFCQAQNFNDWKNLNCERCNKTCGLFFNFENSKKKFRCVTGTKRKNVRFRKSTIRTLMDIQNNVCAYCDYIFEQFHIDHIVPVSFGGTNNISNLVLSCVNCNLKASNKVFPSFDEKRKFLRKFLKN